MQGHDDEKWPSSARLSRSIMRWSPRLNHERTKRDVDGLSGRLQKRSSRVDALPRRQVNAEAHGVDRCRRNQHRAGSVRPASSGRSSRCRGNSAGTGHRSARHACRYTNVSWSSPARNVKPHLYRHTGRCRTEIRRLPMHRPTDAHARWHEQRVGNQEEDKISEHGIPRSPTVW